MVTIQCLPEADPDRVYEYCPSFAAAVLFTVLFSLATIIHTVQAVHYRKAFSWVLIMGAVWEAAGYGFRSFNIAHPHVGGIFTTQFLLILLAPLWINAFMYMILGRMVHFFLVKDQIFGLRARRLTLMFVLFDISAFLVQLTGGVMSGVTDPTWAKTGLWIYTAGVALALTFVCVFTGIAIRFWQLLKVQSATEKYGVMMEDLEHGSSGYNPAATKGVEDIDYVSRTTKQAAPLFIAVLVALVMIIVRNIYRCVEYSIGGFHGNYMTEHEWMQYVFDALLMLIALGVLAWQHPGMTLQGERSDFSTEDTQRKQEKKAKKNSKAAKKAEKKGKYFSVNAGNNSSDESLANDRFVHTGQQ